MTEKTVIISAFDETLEVSKKVAFNKVIATENEIIEEDVVVEYDSLTPEEKVKFDEIIVILESKLP